MLTSTPGFGEPPIRRIVRARLSSTSGSRTERSSDTSLSPRTTSVALMSLRLSVVARVIPGYLLALLAVATSQQGQGHRGELLAEALQAILAVMRLGGGRVIVVDAIDERARGFRAVPANPDRLIMKASTAAASLSVDWPLDLQG